MNKNMFIDKENSTDIYKFDRMASSREQLPQ